MKQRLKGLLALVLSLTMVLGLMTCAWGVEYKIYVDYSSGSEVYKLGVSDGNGGYTEKNPDLFNVNDSVTNSNGSGSVLVFDGEKFAPVGTVDVYKVSDSNNAIDGLASFETFSANEKYIYKGVGLAKKDGETLVSLDYGASYDIPYIHLVPACTVTFALQGHGTMTTATQTDIPKGEKVDKPADPTENGWTFGGWYKEQNCTTKWDFNTDTVTADITLYAKWTENSTGGPTTPQPPTYYPIYIPTVEDEPEVTAPNTFDGGIASAVVVTILSATGGAWLAKKKD